MKSLTLKTTQTIELAKLTQWLLLFIALLLGVFACTLTWWFAPLLIPVAIQILNNKSKIEQQTEHQLMLNSEQTFLLLNNQIAQAQKLTNHWQTPQFLILSLSNNQQKHHLLIKRSALSPEQFTRLTLALDSGAN